MSDWRGKVFPSTPSGNRQRKFSQNTIYSINLLVTNLFIMPTKVNKTNHIGIRATDAEKLDWELKAHAEGLKTSQLARNLLNNYSNDRRHKKRLTPSKVDKARSASLVRSAQSRQDLIRQVARIGNNLNQIARWANTHKGAAEATQVIASLAKIETSLLELKHCAN
ncbi:MAG: MobC family plasmid mobilization relaxosome protein [Cyanobacteria bacterium J06621_12]